MSDTQHLTVDDLRRHLKQLAKGFDQLEEYAAMYGQVYADDISEEIALSLRALASDAVQLAEDHEAAHARDAVFQDEVERTLSALPVQGDLLAAPPFAGPEPQTDREDRTADDHDRWLKDWNGTEEDDQ